MFFPQRLPGLLCLALCCLLGVTSASAEWLVYEFKFTPEEDSVNFSTYTGAYIVAPAQGGEASIILTTEDGGRYYAVSEGGGKFFVAANQHQRKAVFSAAVLRGSAQAFYAVSGRLNRSLLLDTPDGTRSLRVAEFIEGRLIAADDEGGLAPAADGSFGMIGGATIQGVLREDLTANATLTYTSLAGATNYVVELLEKYGYNLDTGEVPAGAESPPGAAATQPAENQIDPSLFPQALQGQSAEP
jgi:hypothetical protein